MRCSYLLQVVPFLAVAGRNSHIVEDAEPHWIGSACMMAWRPYQSKTFRPNCIFAIHDGIHSCQR